MSTTNFIATEEQSKNYQVSSRKWLAKGKDVYVKEFTLAAKEEVPWHTHSNVFDIFYCIQGEMIIEVAEAASKKTLPSMPLNVGDSARVDVGTAHRPFNPGPGICRFIIIQGVGDYDFLPFSTS